MLHKRDWFSICKVALISGAFGYIFGDPLPSFSQSIVPDNTLGSESSIVTPNVELNNQIIDLINGGASRGSTLFHSFDQFNVNEGQQVYFANPSDIANIFSRVTGNNHSDIFGTLGVLGDANLYLLNPNGIIFGPNARLDVAGSFAASTSGGVVFDNGYTFSATNPDSPPLLTVTTPLGISQWLPPTGDITSTGNLSAGQDLSFIGQTIDLEGGQLTAGSDLKLKASELLTIEDTATNPFIAMAGGEFVAQGNQGLTLSILNHANSGLSSNGNMTLRSANDIQLDGHYATNGQFSVEQLDGTPGNSFAADDPIVLAAGDVKLGNYEGASLHILAGGSVELGTVTINNTGPTASTINSNNDTLIPGTNTPYSALSNVTLSDGTSVTVNGDSQATLDVRAGIDWTQAPFTGVPGIPTPTDIPTGSVTFETPSLSGSNISVGKIEIAQSGGLVLLTNQYQPNLALSNGSIQVESLITAADKLEPQLPMFELGGDIAIDARGDLSIAANSEIASVGLVGGDVTMNSGTSILFNDSSKIESVSFTQANGLGGDISLTAPTIQLTNNNEVETLYVGSEQGGAINISTSSLSLRQGSRINTATSGTGNAGAVSVEADSIVLENSSTISSETSFVRGGNAGEVVVTTNTLMATDGSQIFSSTAGVGNAGNVSVIATESIKLIGTSGDNPSGIVSAVLPFLNIPNGPFFADASDFPALPDALFPMGIRRGNGNAGMVSVETGKLLLEDGGQIRTTTVASGNAGQIDVNADEIEIKGAVLGPNFPIPSGILSEVAPTSKGQGNDITINTNQLSVTDSGFISASTSGQSEAGSNAGNINIDVTGAAIFDGDKGGDFDPSGVYVGTLAGATGGGGTLTINAASLSVRNGAQLEALTESSQDAGKIFVNANSIQLFGEDTGVFSNAAEGSSGNGGLVEITGNALILKDGAQISTDTAGSGNAGNTVVNVDNVITIMGENTGIFSSTTPESTGNSGSIFIDPNLVQIRDGGAISVDSEGTGTGGSIQLQGGQLILDNGRISAEAASDDGGNIALSLDNIIILRGGSLISATAGIDSGFGNGGNIQIATPFVVAVPGQNSDITANAFEGDGGNIGISTNDLFFIEFRDLDNPREVMTNDITVSSELGIDGTFSLTSPEIDPESGLIKLPDQLADTSNQVVKTCAAAEGNVFTITGRGGVPSDPTAPIRGQTLLSDVRDFAATAPENQPQAKQPVPNPVESTSERRYLVEATGWVKNEQGEIELVAAVPQETLPNQYANCVGAH
ncbi:MAG: filamentous hemagglutinin N-terminal domain-containing protein [Coleofasciculus sp. B1-GNL1-01]|uniref:two-partner secretion domain-containing protein n=1 Tax=Coleofasciculus sp. B1-GNL1-01 TaxID=3068484 RepID=UPI003302FF6B